MEKSLLTVKTDRKLKESAQRVARDLGLPLGTVVNAYLREFVRERRVVFSQYPVPNERTLRLLQQARDDFYRGKNIAGPFSSGKEMDKHLDS